MAELSKEIAFAPGAYSTREPVNWEKANRLIIEHAFGIRLFGGVVSTASEQALSSRLPLDQDRHADAIEGLWRFTI